MNRLTKIILIVAGIIAFLWAIDSAAKFDIELEKEFQSEEFQEMLDYETLRREWNL